MEDQGEGGYVGNSPLPTGSPSIRAEPLPDKEAGQQSG